MGVLPRQLRSFKSNTGVIRGWFWRFGKREFVSVPEFLIFKNFKISDLRLTLDFPEESS